ncbi:MAG TPA: hypothetical protein VHN77_06900, partial [Phycisphaerales bacterium]|nr:hypothetical protein [Phycisphaerales bacterium]
LDGGKPAEAEPLFREAAAMLLRPENEGAAWGAKRTDTLISHALLASSLEKLGRIEEAEAPLLACMAAAEGKVPAGDRYEWILLLCRSALGEVRLKKGDAAGAAAMINPAAARMVEVAPQMGPKSRAMYVPVVLDRAARAAEAAGDAGKAAEWRAATAQFK